MGSPQLPEPRATGSERSPRQTERAGEMNIAVIVERDDNGEFLIRELQRMRANVKHLWPVPAQIPLQFDAIFCALSKDLPQRIPWVPGEPSSALIVVDDGKEPLNLKLIHNCAAHGLLHYPATSRMIQSVLMLAREHFQYERRLRSRIEKLDENLRTTRLVERAKVLLIRLKNLSEEEAYNFLRKQAMEKRVTIGAVASAVIDSHELLS
ncbi:ANTAR domain-containing protein [Mesorhizobium denitrificans]|uniref:ANTAR domain-containing protein n=3 Tax=Mesorhizobium TaxID=68287 RepID=A0A371XCN1_9HYPH|nr:ANTAR domain-containing protein [Mesorhizobium denitrificans]